MYTNYIKIIDGFEANPIGIGTWRMGGDMRSDFKNDIIDIEAIQYSISKGQNFIDTAEMYGNGHTEEIVGHAIKDFSRNKLFIASKIWRNSAKRDQVIPSVEKMLKRLKTDYLDLLYIHWPFEGILMEEYIKGINDAQDAILTKAIGVSNFNIEQLKQAIKISKYPILANQIHFNILYRADANDEMLKFCKDNNITIVAYQPIESGMLADDMGTKLIKDIANKYNKTSSQIALNWLISKQNIIAIPKSSNLRHIDENLESLSFEISDEDMKKLNDYK